MSRSAARVSTPPAGSVPARSRSRSVPAGRETPQQRRPDPAGKVSSPAIEAATEALASLEPVTAELVTAELVPSGPVPSGPVPSGPVTSAEDLLPEPSAPAEASTVRALPTAPATGEVSLPDDAPASPVELAADADADQTATESAEPEPAMSGSAMPEPAMPEPATSESEETEEPDPEEVASPVNYDDEGLGEVLIEGLIYRFDSGKQGSALCLSARKEGVWRWSYLGELRWDGRDLRSKQLDRQLLGRLSESLRELASASS